LWVSVFVFPKGDSNPEGESSLSAACGR